MTAQDIRQKFLRFFESKKHKIISSSSLIPEDDASVLFTTAGMQQFKPYFAGKKDIVKDFGNKNLVSVQKIFRTSDIDSVGDESHLTFFEMLGNFSIGGYGKKEAIEYAWELMTSKDWYGLPKDKFFATVFAGDDEIPADTESEKFWKEVAPNIEVKKFGREDNFWPSPVWAGTCGPSSEVHYILDDGSSIEVWNLVFTQYFHNDDGSFKDLGQVNIDTGMGLERLAMISQRKQTIFQTDFFRDAIDSLQAITKTPTNYIENPKPFRIIAEHLRAAIFMVADGVIPSNKQQGYVLRRLIRRCMIYARELGMVGDEWLSNIIHILIQPYSTIYPELIKKFPDINVIITQEVDKFRKTIKEGLKEEKKIEPQLSDEKLAINLINENIQQFKISNEDFIKSLGFAPKSLTSVAAGTVAFELQSTYGLPAEEFRSIIEEKNVVSNFQPYEFDKSLDTVSNLHQELSRSASAGMFKGGLADHSEMVIKYHTATHLLHQALRDVLGPQVFQQGSNITTERLRFDFSYDKKMTDLEIKATEDLINKRIKENLKVDHMIVDLEKAKKMNAIGLFNEKYANQVSIYGVGPDFKLEKGAKDQRARGGYYSLEFCGGPHVEHTAVLGEIKITKEEAVSQGMRRIRAEIVVN